MKQRILIEEAKWAKKLKGLSLRVFHKLEGNQNANPSTNGESLLVDKLLEDWSKNLSEDPIVFDVGANKGEYAKMWLQAAEKNGIQAQLHLFEPTETCFNLLKEKFGKQKVTINQLGLSSTAEEREIFYDKKGSTLASLYDRDLDKEGLKLDQKEAIKLIKLSDYLKTHNIKHIHFLKLDVEGHELESLAGMDHFLSPDFVNYIQFEYGGANVDAKVPLKQLYDLLESKGFKMAKIKSQGVELRTYQASMENYAYANYLAIGNTVL